MARSQKQKLKLLYLMRFLLQQSDEQHPVGISQMVDELAAHDIPAERKSLYDDIEALRAFGLDVVQARGKTLGYYIGTREFELPELKLLVDSVQSSKFITQRKTISLIRKIESLASVHDAVLLQRQVYVRNRVKSMNESVYYNVDEISSAITADRMIRFRYFEYTVAKERRFRHDGAYYEVSPYALMWDDENYYMLAYDAAAAISSTTGWTRWPPSPAPSATGTARPPSGPSTCPPIPSGCSACSPARPRASACALPTTWPAR